LLLGGGIYNLFIDRTNLTSGHEDIPGTSLLDEGTSQMDASGTSLGRPKWDNGQWASKKDVEGTL